MPDSWDRLESAPVVDRYQELIDNGVPPSVARQILSSPSYAEGQNLHPYPGAGANPWPYPYQGQRRDWISGLDAPRDQSLDERLQGVFRRNPGARNIGYQPGGQAMPGMPWDLPQQPFVPPSLPGNSTQATMAGMGAPSLQPMGSGSGAMGGLTPQQQMIFRLLMSRGAGGMQNLFGGGAQPGQGGGLANQLANSGQSGLMGMIMQNPQLLQWFMQQQGGQGQFPQGGGGVTLAQLLGAPQQATPS